VRKRLASRQSGHQGAEYTVTSISESPKILRRVPGALCLAVFARRGDSTARPGQLCSDVLQLCDRALVDDVAGVQRGRGLEEQKPAFFISHRAMLDSAGHDDEFTFFDPLMAFAKLGVAVLHAEAAFHHQEQLVFVLVMMKDKSALELIELDCLS